MTAFPCYDRVADTLWSFANGEKEAKDRKVFLKGNKLLCYSERHTALMTADFDKYVDEECKDTRRFPEFHTEGIPCDGEGDFREQDHSRTSLLRAEVERDCDRHIPDTLVLLGAWRLIRPLLFQEKKDREGIPTLYTLTAWT